MVLLNKSWKQDAGTIVYDSHEHWILFVLILQIHEIQLSEGESYDMGKDVGCVMCGCDVTQRPPKQWRC